MCSFVFKWYLQIEMGSTNVRVGTSIFGHRDKKPSAMLTDTVSKGMKDATVS
jgi:hypothetical protein